MKRWIISCCGVVLLLVLLCACGSHPIEPNSPELEKNETMHNSADTVSNELYDRAMAILSELDDPRIDDFQTAYGLLMDMPEDKDDFVEQLNEANHIFEKYGIEFKYGGWYLQPYLSDESITAEGLNEYKTKNAYWDAENLMKAIVYPVLFSDYGDDAQHIEGLSACTVISAIESTGEYALDDKNEEYNGCTETWKYIGIPKCDYEIRYHDNGLVESVNVPIIRSDVPMDDADFTDFFAYDLEEQKQFAGNRFSSMVEQLNSIFIGYEVLSQMYTDEEIGIICNYIKALTIDEIWERNMWAYNAENGEPLNYATAAVSFNYKGNSITVHYGLNSVYLTVIGRDYINQLSNKWYTLYCGLILPNGNDDIIESYRDYLDGNVDANTAIHEWSFDLDSNAQNYIESTTPNADEGAEVDTTDSSVNGKIVLSMSESITVEGIIERNTNEFPQYRLKLSNPTTIAFTEYGEDQEFYCVYLYFYDDTEINGGYDFASLINLHCTVTALLEDYRGGSELYFVMPEISVSE